jgi:DNA-directed RNA polymerase alpha subunit
MENENMNPLDILLDDVEYPMSVRLIKLMRSEGVVTLGDILKRREYDWLRVPGFGRITLNDLKDVLSNYGLDLNGWRTIQRVPQRVEILKTALREIAKVNNRRDRYSDEIDGIILKALEV